MADENRRLKGQKMEQNNNNNNNSNTSRLSQSWSIVLGILGSWKV